MKVEYEIGENDFLDFQLYTASRSERIKKKEKTGHLFLTLGCAMALIYFYVSRNTFMVAYFGILTLLFGLFYPRYFKWRYKRHYGAFIRENYAKRFGHTETLELHQDHIFAKDKTGESRLNLSEIEKADETDRHFFLKISTGLALIIPKDKLEDAAAVKGALQKLGIIVDRTDTRGWT